MNHQDKYVWPLLCKIGPVLNGQKKKIWDGTKCKICFFISSQKIKSKAVLKSAMGGAELPYYDPWMLYIQINCL